MHFCLVCNMNKIVRVLVLYILVLATTGAADITSKNKTTTTKEWKRPETTRKWKELTTTPKPKEATTTTRWRTSTTTAKWKYPTTTTKTTEATTARSWKQLTTTKATPTNRRASQTPVNHGVVAVASFSGVDSRNGRLSPMNDIKIFSPADSSMVKSDDNGNFIIKSVNGKMPMPITITKQGDGVSGTIRILPGSVSVSSSASSSKSGPATAVAASYSPWPAPFMKPIMNDIYFPPFPTFPPFPSMPDPIFEPIPMSINKKMADSFSFMRFQEPSFPSRIQDPWLDKDVFKQPQRKHDMFQHNWFYPSFNPFINYWR